MNQQPFQIVTAEDRERWDSYVAAHPKGTIFHTSDMVRVFAATRQHEPLAIAAVNGAGDIVAMLVAVHVRTLNGAASRFASRSIQYAEPICNDDEEGIAGLVALVRHHDGHMKSRTLFSEVRPIAEAGPERIALERCGYEYQDYLNYVVDLTAGRDCLWRNLRKSCRQNVSRCHRKNVTVRDETTSDGIRKMYELLQYSYERAKVPLADCSLFRAALDRLPPGVVQVRIAYHHDTPVAGGIVLNFKKRVYAWYGGTVRVPGITPFDCLTWDEIEWGGQHGLQWYDFGGAGWPDEEYGPRKFKAKFGGELVSYGRYRKVYSGWKLAVAKTSYRMLRSVVSPTAAK